MAKNHMRIYAECDDFATATSYGEWLGNILDNQNLNPNPGWGGDGEVMILEAEPEMGTPARVTFFGNVNENFSRTGLSTSCKNRMNAENEVTYLRTDKWICTHDEDYPQPCVPEIIEEEGIKV